MLFFLSPRQDADMARETVPQRIQRLAEQAVRSGKFPSVSSVATTAGLSRSYIAERVNAAKKDRDASVGADAAAALARALGITVEELLGTKGAGEQPLVDVYPNRAWAIQAARNLDLPEAAIQVVLSQDPGRDLHKMAWFHRIEAEAENLRPASNPAG